MHQHTYIGKKKYNNNKKNNNNKNNNKTTIQQQGEHLVRCMHLLRIKRQLQNYFNKITYSKAVCFNSSIMELM